MLVLLKTGTQMTPHQLWQLSPDTPAPAVLVPVPVAFCPDETLEDSWPSVTGKGDMTSKETESDRESVPQMKSFLGEE